MTMLRQLLLIHNLLSASYHEPKSSLQSLDKFTLQLRERGEEIENKRNGQFEIRDSSEETTKSKLGFKS